MKAMILNVEPNLTISKEGLRAHLLLWMQTEKVDPVNFKEKFEILWEKLRCDAGRFSEYVDIFMGADG